MLDLNALERIDTALNDNEPKTPPARPRPGGTGAMPAPRCPHLARIAAE
ncbi:MAG: hypothetical protein AAGF79_10170 [Pseudomonadota bacterium]